MWRVIQQRLQLLLLRCSILVLCAAAAVMPVWLDRESNCGGKAAAAWVGKTGAGDFPGWPAEFEGEPLREIPLSAREARFHAAFPGRIGKFSDGRREFVLRWVTAGTRKLHSSADCFRGLGYTVSPQPAMRDAAGREWSCFTARRGPREIRVRERVADTGGRGAWTDVSAWFWSAALRRSSGPWLATTVAEPVG